MRIANWQPTTSNAHRYGKKNTHHNLKIVVHNRQNFGTRYTEHRDALADLEPELEFGRVAIRQWLLKRNNTRSSSGSDEDLDRDRIRIAQKQQLSPQRIYFQELQKRKMEWERRRKSDGDDEFSSSVMGWLWVEGDDDATTQS